MWSAVALTSVVTTDVMAPGAPSFAGVRQISNSQIEATVNLPTLDSDGSELSGLSKLVVATAPFVEGINPFEGLSMPEILALPGVVTAEVVLTDEDAGQQKPVVLPITNLGGNQAVAAACNDE